MVARWVLDGCLHQPEVRCSIVRGDEEAIVVMGDAILHPGLARLDQPERLLWTVRTDEVDFRGGVARDIEHQILSTPCAANVDKERRVGLEIDQRVLRRVSAHHVPVEPTRTPRLVENGIEKHAAVVGPSYSMGGLLDAPAQELTGGEILDV